MSLSLVDAITTSNMDTVKDLLENDPGAVNAVLQYQGKKYTPLTLATTVWLTTKTGRTRDNIMNVLLSAPGIDINGTDSDGNTCLIIACKSSRSAMIKNLILRGVNVDARNNDGQDAADVAVNSEIKRILQAFSKDSLDQFVMDIINDDREEVSKKIASNPDLLNYRFLLYHHQYWTPLGLALWNNCRRVVDLLINNRDLDYNLQDPQGRTALMSAVHILNNIDFINRLLKNMTPEAIAVKDNVGNSALDHAGEDAAAYKHAIKSRLPTTHAMPPPQPSISQPTTTSRPPKPPLISPPSPEPQPLPDTTPPTSSLSSMMLAAAMLMI